MNELISEQARQYANENHPGSFVKYDPEWFALYNKKFAELIVLKCADIINHRADTCSDWLDSVKANEAVREGQRECAKTIKHHFGVER